MADKVLELMIEELLKVSKQLSRAWIDEDKAKELIKGVPGIILVSDKERKTLVETAQRMIEDYIKGLAQAGVIEIQNGAPYPTRIEKININGKVRGLRISKNKKKSHFSVPTNIVIDLSSEGPVLDASGLIESIAKGGGWFTGEAQASNAQVHYRDEHGKKRIINLDPKNEEHVKADRLAHRWYLPPKVFSSALELLKEEHPQLWKALKITIEQLPGQSEITFPRPFRIVGKQAVAHIIYLVNREPETWDHIGDEYSLSYKKVPLSPEDERIRVKIIRREDGTSREVELGPGHILALYSSGFYHIIQSWSERTPKLTFVPWEEAERAKELAEITPKKYKLQGIIGYNDITGSVIRISEEPTWKKKAQRESKPWRRLRRLVV